MSSTNKTANYELSQFVGTDIPSYLNDYNGDMRKIDSAIHNASVAGGDNATAIAELQSSTARMNTEISGINSTVNTLSGKVLGIEGVIPATASAENKLLTAQELPEIPSISGLETSVANIESVIPSNASPNNKLATMADAGVSGDIEVLMDLTPENGETWGDFFNRFYLRMDAFADIPVEQMMIEVGRSSQTGRIFRPFNTSGLDSWSSFRLYHGELDVMQIEFMVGGSTYKSLSSNSSGEPILRSNDLTSLEAGGAKLIRIYKAN